MEKKLALVSGIALILVAAWQLGLLSLFANPSRVKDTLLSLGPLGYLAFVGAFTVLQPFGVPGMGFVISASLVWRPEIATPLSILGSTTASMVGFSFSRYLARDWVEHRIPERFRKYDDRLAERGFATVFVLRFLFLMNPMLHALFGVSRVRFSTHLLASVLAYVVPIAVITFLGDAAFSAVRHLPAREQLELALAIGALAIGIGSLRGFLRQRRQRQN
jgi:uncharacterized membrane protein YdjX (TVP38/TMEM64 family)